ncbi:MAG: PhzF family phenazine biosynthesis protein, partial [Armatimonadetes bacterium]|nr:PhzF family phenazine biosynthesis protein [Armatimonadota bacterium]
MVDFHLVDVFVGEGAAGNPAGVVPRADGLSDAEMQRVATALGVSDTAFVFHEGGLRLRWFTPGREIDLCCHSTLAAAQVLGITAETTFAYGGGTLAVRPEPIGGEL